MVQTKQVGCLGIGLAFAFFIFLVIPLSLPAFALGIIPGFIVWGVGGVFSLGIIRVFAKTTSPNPNDYWVWDGYNWIPRK
jgi:hypothetical protein